MTFKTNRAHIRRCISVTKGGDHVIEHELPLDPSDTFMPKIQQLFAQLGEPPKMEVPHGGRTGYLDYLKPEDMPLDSSVAWGVDPHGRPFFCLRLIVNYSGEEIHKVVTFHRRYDQGSVWVPAGGYAAEFFPDRAMDQEHLDLLRDVLIRGNTLHSRKERDIFANLY